MEKMNPAQKMNNKVEGTPKPESKKVNIQSLASPPPLVFHSLTIVPSIKRPTEVKLFYHHQ